MDPQQVVVLINTYYLLMMQGFFQMMQTDFERTRLMIVHEREVYRKSRIRRDLVVILSAFSGKRRRRCWQRKRSDQWWNDTVQDFEDEQWLENFRLRQGTFNWICNELDDILRPHPRPVIPGQAIPTKKIVAIALYKLAHGAEYSVIGDKFGVHKSSVHNCVYAFCYALTQSLSQEYIRFPNEEEAAEVSKCFEEITHIPQIVGVIDGLHIPITPPKEGNTDFINRKMYTSIVLQAIVDHQYIFRDISCKLPGSHHDYDALQGSDFYNDMENIMPKGVKTVDGMDIPFMLLGDSAYPLDNWLIKNYVYNSNISEEQDSFNTYMNKGRVLVENAFGRLKGRWRILQKQNDLSYTFAPTLVAACCLLHNICEMNMDMFNNAWMRDVEEAEVAFPQPETVAYDAENKDVGEDIRDHLTQYLAKNFELLQSTRESYAVM